MTGKRLQGIVTGLVKLTTTTQAGRDIEMAAAVGSRDEDSFVLHLFGEVTYRGQTYAVQGATTVREGRDKPDAHFLRLDTGEALAEDVAYDILYAVFLVLDKQPDCILAREMNRICG